MIDEIFSRIIWLVEIIKDFVIIVTILYFFSKGISMKIKQRLKKRKELKREEKQIYINSECEVQEI